MIKNIIKCITITIVCILLITVTVFLVDAAEEGSIKILLGLEEPSNYVSDDFATLYIDGKIYEKVEIPFDMPSPKASYSEYGLSFANSKYEHSKIYIESVSRRYPFVWINDINYHLYANYLSSDIVIMQISNEYTNELYNYCLSEQRSEVEKIVSGVSWSDNNLFAEYIDHNGNLIDGVNKEKISSDLSSYIITAREKLLSDVTSRREIEFADRSSAVGVSIYQYDNGMNFRKKMFDIMVLTNGNYYLYDDFYMYYASNTPNATIDDYNYLLIPEMFNEKIKQYQEKAKQYQNQ